MTFIAPRRLGSDSLLGVIGADMGTEQSTSRIFDTEIFPGSRAILATASGITSYVSSVMTSALFS